MTPNRDWFHTYEPISEGSVFMGDNHALEIAGIGTIKLKMYDGLIRTISGVRHVKDLKKNLLSIGQFDSFGCKIRTDNEIMKIVKGALVILKVRKTVANMFVLMGETHHGAEASIASWKQMAGKTDFVNYRFHFKTTLKKNYFLILFYFKLIFYIYYNIILI